jgi:hypothetical protein
MLRFSEVVRRANSSGPQLVTIRGKEADVILAPEQYGRLMPKDKKTLPLVPARPRMIERGHREGERSRKAHRSVNGWLLDTNVIAEISGARPDPKVESSITSRPEHMLFLSIPTIGE